MKLASGINRILSLSISQHEKKATIESPKQKPEGKSRDEKPVRRPTVQSRSSDDAISFGLGHPGEHTTETTQPILRTSLQQREKNVPGERQGLSLESQPRDKPRRPPTRSYEDAASDLLLGSLGRQSSRMASQGIGNSSQDFSPSNPSRADEPGLETRRPALRRSSLKATSSYEGGNPEKYEFLPPAISRSDPLSASSLHSSRTSLRRVSLCGALASASVELRGRQPRRQSMGSYPPASSTKYDLPPTSRRRLSMRNKNSGSLGLVSSEHQHNNDAHRLPAVSSSPKRQAVSDPTAAAGAILTKRQQKQVDSLVAEMRKLDALLLSASQHRSGHNGEIACL
jgi:hypothetical protein